MVCPGLILGAPRVAVKRAMARARMRLLIASIMAKPAPSRKNAAGGWGDDSMMLPTLDCSAGMVALRGVHKTWTSAATQTAAKRLFPNIRRPLLSLWGQT